MHGELHLHRRGRAAPSARPPTARPRANDRHRRRARRGSLPNGTAVEVTRRVREPGTLVYNRGTRMQAAGETDADTCAYNDLALIKLDPADYGKVQPVGARRSAARPRSATRPRSVRHVYTLRQLLAAPGHHVLSPKIGMSLGALRRRLDARSVYTVTPGIPRRLAARRFMDDEGTTRSASCQHAPARADRARPTASRTCARCSATRAPTAART